METAELKAAIDELKAVASRLETALAGDTLSPIGLLQRVSKLETEAERDKLRKGFWAGVISAITSGAVTGAALLFTSNS